jgi:hypothetical protein
MLSGGQFSRRIPRDKPRDAKTSLISVKDFLPKLGVLRSSTSACCTKSPMYCIASALRQLALRTVSSRSSLDEVKLGQIKVSLLLTQLL